MSFTPRLPTWNTTCEIWWTENGDGVYSLFREGECQLYTPRVKIPVQLAINEETKHEGPLAVRAGQIYMLLLLPADVENLQLLDPYSVEHDFHPLVVHSCQSLGHKLYYIDQIEPRWQGWPNEHVGCLLRRISRDDDPRIPSPIPVPNKWCMDVEGFLNGVCINCDAFNVHVEMNETAPNQWESNPVANPCAPPATYVWILTRNHFTNVFTLILRTSDGNPHVNYRSQLIGWEEDDPLLFSLQSSDTLCDFPLSLTATLCAGVPPGPADPATSTIEAIGSPLAVGQSAQLKITMRDAFSTPVPDLSVAPVSPVASSEVLSPNAQQATDAAGEATWDVSNAVAETVDFIGHNYTDDFDFGAASIAWTSGGGGEFSDQSDWFQRSSFPFEGGGTAWIPTGGPHYDSCWMQSSAPPETIFTANSIHAPTNLHTLPPSAIITGIEVLFDRYDTTDEGLSGAIDVEAYINLRNNTIVSEQRSRVQTWESNESVVYGGPADLWGFTDLVADDFNVASLQAFVIVASANVPDSRVVKLACGRCRVKVWFNMP